MGHTHFFEQLPREQSRHRMVVERLRDAIAEGAVGVGEHLPSERELCEQFGVSRSIVREAIRVLTSQGILKVSQGRRAMVTADLRTANLLPMRRLVEDTARQTFGDVLEARLILEVAAAERAAQKATVDDIAAMTEALEALRLAAPNSDSASQAHVAFHAAVAHASKNLFVGHMIVSLLENATANGPQPSESVQTQSDTTLLPLGYEAHAQIFRPICEHRVAAAGRAMHEHLSSTIDHHPGLQG